MKEVRRRDSRCYRLYIGNGNWINLSPETTHDLTQIYENGVQTRYELAPGVCIDILPHDVDCNSKNTDLPRLMRADLNYQQKDQSQETTQQELSHYIKSLLESQGIIDAFPPTKPEDTLPLVTTLPTHRHLSMVPTQLSAVRRSNRSAPKGAELIASPVPTVVGQHSSASSSSSPLSGSTSSYSPSKSLSPGDKRFGSENKKKRTTNKRPKRRRSSNSKAAARKKYTKPISSQRATSSKPSAAATRMFKTAFPGLDCSISNARTPNSPSSVFFDSPFHMFRQQEALALDHPSTKTTPASIVTRAQTSPQNTCYPHPPPFYNSLLSHTDPIDHASFFESSLMNDNKRPTRTRAFDEVLPSQTTVTTAAHPSCWMDRDVWNIASGNNEQFGGPPSQSHMQSMESYTTLSSQLEYSERSSIASVSLQMDPPRYDLCLMRMGVSSPSPNTCADPRRFGSSFSDTNIFSYAADRYVSEYDTETIQEQHQKYASMAEVQQQTRGSLYNDPVPFHNALHPTSSPASNSH
ncbi:hypothetical protein DFQ30_007517 [Apophysomyces sp. BC1015]|nr:hypothetical protein DFQ30_007517 [Apophysomyces sp. BC1015]